MRTLGTVQLPTEAFMAVLKLDEDKCIKRAGAPAPALFSTSALPFVDEICPAMLY